MIGVDPQIFLTWRLSFWPGALLMLRGWMTKVPWEFSVQPGGVWATTAAVRVARAMKDFIVAEEEEMTGGRDEGIIIKGISSETVFVTGVATGSE